MDKQQDNENFAQEEGSYGIPDQLIEDITTALEQNDFVRLEQLISPLHAADRADLIYRLNASIRRQYIEAIKDRLGPQVLVNMEPSIRSEIIDQVGLNILVRAILDLESDDAFYLIEELPPPQQYKILNAIPAQNRIILEEGLGYPEDSAGRLMQREIVCVPPFWSIKEVLNFIQESQDLPEVFYDLFVVDPRYHPIGLVPLSKLMRKNETKLVSEIMSEIPKTIPVTMDQEEVAVLFRHYALVSAPVVDQNGRIIGTITVDDVVEVIDEEAEEDIMHLGGVSELDFRASSFKTAYWRSRWLVVTLVNTLIAANVISQFASSIQENVMLSFLMGICAAMGGNAGMQTVTVMVRALATRELKPDSIFKPVLKEISVSLMTGVLFALILGAIVAFWLEDPALGLVLGGALVFNMIWAGLAGTFLPIFIQRIGMDPAISAGPMLTTTTDVIGYAVFLGLATYFLL